jgi:hypothetical protein
MQLDDFVAETLRQIIAGVKKVQGTEDGMNVNAAGVTSSGHLLANIYGNFTRVDFDVAVTAESSGGSKASLKVWSIGAEGGGEHKSQTANRVSFSIPVRLPEGDQSKEEERRRQFRKLRDTGSSGY